MRILETAARKTILGVLLLLLKEIRHLNRTLEIATDSFRIANGQQPQFTVAKDEPSIDIEAERVIPHYESEESGWLRRDILETLCREAHLSVDDNTDVEKIAAARGWVDRDGQLCTLPVHYGD
ncbi:MAG: hypothetical protein DMF56_26940 [Acidobacteria bacterium]|nr:MAG: hypothetical protein DMF56_26940 [Acidobacteriota bacterium]